MTSAPTRTTTDRPAAGTPQRAVITAIHNDYLECTLSLPNQSQVIKVAKPYKLRHAAGNYATLTSIAPVNPADAQKIVASGPAGPDETWVVRPLYEVGDAVMVQAGVETGVTVAGEQLSFQDTNEDGRLWAVDQSGGGS